MAIGGREDIVDMEFGPELAGHRVGRVRTQTKERDDGETIVNIDVATALVGTGGAQVTHIELEDGKEAYHAQSTKGFAVASAVSLTALRGETDIHPAQWHLVSSRLYPNALDKRPEAGHILRSGADSIHEGDILDITWFNTPAEGLEALRFALSFGKMESQFDRFYFNLNHGLLHPALRPDDYDRLYLNSGYYDNAMASRRMHEATKEELAKATQVSAFMAAQFSENLRIGQEIEQADPKQIANEFTRSRRNAHRIEMDLKEVAGSMVEPGAVYLSVDFHGGRSWPYMDASNANEQQAFGREHVNLVTGSNRAAVVALESEHSDLGRRLEFTIQGRRALKALLNIESRIAD